MYLLSINTGKRKKKLCVSDAAVALETGDKPSVVSLLGILYIVQDIVDSGVHRPPLAGVQGENSRSCYWLVLL